MEKNTKRFLMFGVLAMFMFMFAMQFVTAMETVPVYSDNPIANWFKTIFGDWEAGENFSANIAKYLFWALVSMLVYSVASKLPGISGMFTGGKEFLGMAFSVIVGFLAMAYITPEEITVMMTSYSAMGFVLGGAIPFIILVAFTFTLGTNTTGGASQQLANKGIAWAMWVGFVAFIGYKAFNGLGVKDSMSTFYWIILIVAIVILVKMGALFTWVRKQKTETETEVATNKTEKATAKTKMDAGAIDELAKE